MNTKPCAKCAENLPLSSFAPHKRMKLGRQSYCRPCARAWHREHPECVREKNRAWRENNPTYSRDWQRAKIQGAPRAEVDALRARQGGRCAGCVVGLSQVKECLDHDHATGRVRGLLCNDCNLGLGRLRDNPETLLRLAAYVAREEAEEYQ